MRINHNISSMITQGTLNKVNREMTTSLERLSTGLRINRASDDAAGLGVSENLRTQIRGTAQARRNAQDGIAALTIAEGAANEISDLLQRMRELAIQSANDTLTDTERAYTNQEFQQLIAEIDRIAEVTNYNGMKLISDTEGQTTNTRFGMGDGSFLWIDANASDSDNIRIQIAALSTEGLNIDEENVSDQAGSRDAIVALDDAIDGVNTMRANMGAYINRLEHAINNLTISNTNQQSAESLIRDVDFAHESSRFTRNQILTQSGTAMLAQANMTPQSVLSLIG
ncbi:Flagellin protein FlaA [Chitinispirillum alkaliphilum]|nr:Flagellin protein FlaA [Chitinispirillum alkaliphilum]